MDNMHNKCYFFKVYSSANEKINDINKLQDEYKSKSVSSEEKYPLFDLEVGDVFKS